MTRQAGISMHLLGRPGGPRRLRDHSGGPTAGPNKGSQTAGMGRNSAWCA